MRFRTIIPIFAAAGLTACSQYVAPPSLARIGDPSEVPTNSVSSYVLSATRLPEHAPMASSPASYAQITPAGLVEMHEHSRPAPGGSWLNQRLLVLQNTVRAKLGEEPLAWSNRLAVVAQAWADHLIATRAFVHTVGDPYGENLFEIIGGAATPKEVVSAWADEVRDYDPQTNVCLDGVDCGHYTQIVWSTTRAVGCAYAAASSRQVWVCEYYPAGNIIGYRPF